MENRHQFFWVCETCCSISCCN